VASDTTVF
jgi:glucosamine--fructose-6-phosphate aminotransferase (isomerizing)